MLRIKRIKIKTKDILLYITVFLFCIQFFSNHISICTAIDNTGIKHIFLVLTVFNGFLPDLNRRHLTLRYFSFEVKRVLYTVAALLGITFIYMIFNGWSTYWVSQTYFFMAPILFAYVIFKNDHMPKRFEEIVDFFLYILTAFFCLFVLQRILSGRGLCFSFIESESPFELEIAHMFLLLYIFYAANCEWKKAIVAALCCILAWKRMCLVFLIIFTIVNRKIQPDKQVNRNYYITITAIFALIPSIMQIILNDDFSTWFYNTFNVDLIDFMQFRFQSITTAFQSNIKSQGLGTYLYVDVPWYGSYVHMNMHNDIVRLYLEVSIVGLVIFLYGFSSIAKNIYSFIVIIFLFIELAVSHMLGNGSIPFWLLAYILIFYFNSNLNNSVVLNSDADRGRAKK